MAHLTRSTAYVLGTVLLCVLLGSSTPALADDPTDAARVGRGLLAQDAEVRRDAVEGLLARIKRGGDLTSFLADMGAAAADWANDRERLLDTWIEQAVHGSAAEREEAARLLAVLGPHAIARLAEELRHARAQGGRFEAASRVHSSNDAGADAGQEPTAEPEADSPPEQPAGILQLYNVRDLMARGMNAVEVRSLLQKVPDAVEVKDIGRGVYVVMAEMAGHQALRLRLETIRATPAANAYAEAPTTPAPDRVARWEIEATVYRAPFDTKDARQSYSSGMNGEALPDGLRSGTRTQVHTGTALDAAMWTRLLQRGPNAAQGVEAVGQNAIAAGQNGLLFAGEERLYRKALVRGKDGSWGIENGTLHLGIDLDIALVAGGSTLDLHVAATRTVVQEPIAVTRVSPTPAEAPVELELPEWSKTRARASLTLPLEGGAALLSLGELGGHDREQVIVVLQVKPAR
ncbi:MAG: hypothetical protein O2894_05320 [Planctomycetota bacterium]|nr:hypothetical protein [Planctomycetota bacterium]